MADIRINLYRDVADALRNEMASGGYDIAPVKDNDDAAIRLYAKLGRRLIESRARQILKASNFDPSNHESALAKLEYAIQSGDSLSPYMSKTIVDAKADDSLLDNWRIYHFHLGTELEDGGQFIRRTGEILLCRVDDSFAYFIAVLPHGRNVSAPWYRKELIEIIHKNWPESIGHALAPGVTGLHPKLNDQEVAELRKSGNITLPLEMSDGTVYMPPGVGNTLGLVATDGSSVHDTRFADEIHRLAKLVEEWIIEDYQRTYENARKLGYHFKEPVSLVLSQTQLGVYWDLLEPNSRYRFRVWQDDVHRASANRTALATGS